MRKTYYRAAINISYFTVLFFMLAIIASNSSYAQVLKNVFPQATSQAISYSSRDWKTDSLGKLGLRSKRYQQIERSEIDKISAKQLVEKLGKPNKTGGYFGGKIKEMCITYRYFVNWTYLPEANKEVVLTTLVFAFDNKLEQLIEINVETFCGG